MPARPPSFPYPLMPSPPNGVCGRFCRAPLTYTPPALSRSASRWTRVRLVDWMFAPRPYGVLLASSTASSSVENRNTSSTPYGLGANIQSTNLTRVHRLAERLKAGGVYVNGARQNLPHTPFGGLGISGYGKEGGRAGIDEFLRYKTVSIIEPQ